MLNTIPERESTENASVNPRRSNSSKHHGGRGFGNIEHSRLRDIWLVSCILEADLRSSWCLVGLRAMHCTRAGFWWRFGTAFKRIAFINKVLDLNPVRVQIQHFSEVIDECKQLPQLFVLMPWKNVIKVIWGRKCQAVAVLVYLLNLLDKSSCQNESSNNGN